MSTTLKTASSRDTSIEDLSEQIAILKSDISDLTSTLADYGKTKSSAAAQTAKDAVSDAALEARVKALDAQAQAEDFVRTQPATAIGLAAGIGFLAGLIMTRR